MLQRDQEEKKLLKKKSFSLVLKLMHILGIKLLPCLGKIIGKYYAFFLVFRSI